MGRLIYSDKTHNKEIARSGDMSTVCISRRKEALGRSEMIVVGYSVRDDKCAEIEIQDTGI